MNRDTSSSKSDIYDLFISYRWIEPDMTWVRRMLLPALKKAGLTVLIDMRDFVPGRQIINEQARANRESRRTLSIISPDYVEGNRMTMFEGLKARTQDPAGLNSKLVPLILRKTPIHDLYEGLICVDWTDPDNLETEWSRLLLLLGASNMNVPPPPPVEAGKSKRSVRRRGGKGNYLLISGESDFTAELREMLLARKGELGIGIDYFGDADQNFNQYKAGLFRFLEDTDPNARWLLAVNPHDGMSGLSEQEKLHMLEKLEKHGKKILFFESGMGFKKYKGAENIYVIRTDYHSAVRNLISGEVVSFLKRCTDVHLVTLLGPNCSAANLRRRIYNQFLAAAQYSHGEKNINALPGVDDELIVEASNLISKTMRITSLPLNTWYRTEAERAVVEHYNGNEADVFNTCFICGNDDIALGAYDAVKDSCQRAISERRMAFIGFDGIKGFRDLHKAGLEVATMRVNTEAMCDIAVQIVQDYAAGEQARWVEHDIIVPAEGIAPSMNSKLA